MRVGLISDVHGNLHALRVAIRALVLEGTDCFVVAGDIVGYGPQPNECVSEVAGLPGLVAVAGNHELLVQGSLSAERLPPFVRESVAWTREALSASSLTFLAGLPTVARMGQLAVTHGSLADPSTYVTYPHQATAELARLPQAVPGTTILVLGHTHIPRVFAEDRGTRQVRVGHSMRLEPSTRHIVNPGSVGQSRFREAQPLARFAHLDLDTGMLTFWAMRYDYLAARRALREVGQPDTLLHLKPTLVASAVRPLRQHLSRLRRRSSIRS